jgi:crotonobetainyl-CoA:carnitine CoA-transferase CaiB-like acyl-CoA transferase
MEPFDGLTVVSLEQAVAAPFATRQLPDLGARVIKIERPGTGDFARAYDASVRGQSSYFVWLNRSKESITLDLKKPGGAEILDRLLTRADVFVQNVAPGAADRLGTSPPSCRRAIRGSSSVRSRATDQRSVCGSSRLRSIGAERSRLAVSDWHSGSAV